MKSIYSLFFSHLCMRRFYMVENNTLAQVKQAHQKAQHTTDQTLYTEGEERGDATTAENEEQSSSFVSTESQHPATFHQTSEGNFAIGAYPVIKIEPAGDPTVFCCSTTQPDGTSQDHSVKAWDILRAAQGLGEVPMEREVDWFSAYLYARNVLRMLFSIVFTETTLGVALRYAHRGGGFLDALEQANGLLPLFPTEFSDTASLFASCLSLENMLARLSLSGASANLAPFVQCVLGGNAFLDAFVQMHRARGSLAALIQVDDPLPSINAEIRQGTGARVSVTEKKNEVPPFRDESIESKNTLQLYITLVLGAISFLAVLIQPTMPPLTACLLPLAMLSIAILIAAHELRLFLARHRKVYRTAIFIFDCAALGVILLHAINAVQQHDTATLIQVVIAWIISVGFTISSVIVLRQR
jgi:hypothetical protein